MTLIQKPPLQVGVTGGIGSGKTTVCKIFESLGIPIYYADERAKKLMVDKKEIVESIIDLLGFEAYKSDGSLNRQYIAEIVFKNKEKLEALNQIVHPAVYRDGIEWNYSHQGKSYTIKEAALLVENGSHKFLDFLIVVNAPKELRLRRVMKRDNFSEEEVLDRMNKQLPESGKIALADFIIINDGKQSILKQVWDIHQKLSQ